MFAPQPNTKVLEATTKQAIDNAGKVLDDALAKTSALLEDNVAAAKDAATRTTAYVGSLKDVRSVDDYVAAQRQYGEDTAAAVGAYSTMVYRMTSATAENLFALGERNRAATKELVDESFANVVAAIPTNAANPYGSVIKDAVKAQHDAYQTFSGLFDKAFAAQRDNLSTLAAAVDGQASAAAEAVAPKGNRKRK